MLIREELIIFTGLTLISCLFIVLKIKEFTILNQEKKIKYKSIVLQFLFSMAGLGYLLVALMGRILDINTTICISILPFILLIIYLYKCIQYVNNNMDKLNWMQEAILVIITMIPSLAFGAYFILFIVGIVYQYIFIIKSIHSKFHKTTSILEKIILIVTLVIILTFLIWCII